MYVVYRSVQRRDRMQLQVKVYEADVR
jgi:hypothetical protein